MQRVRTMTEPKNYCTHERFNRKVWAFKHDFTGALAKWLVKQSPYVVPENLTKILEEFHSKLDNLGEFDAAGMLEIDLSTLTDRVDAILLTIPSVMSLNERRNKRQGMGFSSRYSFNHDPDDDFICIRAVAQNITCEFATNADADAYLDYIHEARHDS